MNLANQALDLFPKLYFFVPPAVRRKVHKQGNALVISDAVRAVLWLTDTMCVERKDPQVPLAALRKVLQRLYPKDKVTKTISALTDAGCLRQGFSTGERQYRVLTLTAFGARVVEEIKSEHAALLRALLKDLAATERTTCITSLQAVAQAAWMQMQKGEPRRQRGGIRGKQ